MEWPRVLRNLGLGLLLIAGVAGAVVLGLTVERRTRGQDRALAQEVVIHHFERASWFAMNAGKYEGIDPGLADGFRDSAAWHARRAREFQRMNTVEVPHEAERDAEHDVVDGRLMVRALRCDSTLRRNRIEATKQAERDGEAARPTTPDR